MSTSFTYTRSRAGRKRRLLNAASLPFSGLIVWAIVHPARHGVSAFSTTPLFWAAAPASRRNSLRPFQHNLFSFQMPWFQPQEQFSLSFQESFAGGSSSGPTFSYNSLLANKPQPAPQPLPRTLELTPQERELLVLIRKVRDLYCPSTTIRIAGGWVRDKLLGRQSTSSAKSMPHDIDFVLNNRSGSEFARFLHQYLMETATNSQESSSSTCLSSPPVVALKDYDQTKSKHLQTASVQVGDFSLDFCQMRVEKYQKDSRVPLETSTASIVQDAFRRDLTINALYYNLNTNQVEDWTEQGLRDLQLRQIATPWDPLSTLLEDPLRIFRALRFAAQLDHFNMDPDLLEAAFDLRVRQAVTQKVSRERMGTEVDAIFHTNDPVKGIALLMETNLLNLVFPLRSREEENVTAAHVDMHMPGFQLLFRTQALVSRIFTPTAEWDEYKRRLLWYAAFTKPFCDASSASTTSSSTVVDSPPASSKDTQQQNLGKRRRRESSILYQLLTKGLKRPACDTQSIERIIAGANHLQASQLFTNWQTNSKEEEVATSWSMMQQLSKQELEDLRWQCYSSFQPLGAMWKESLILALVSSSFSTTDEESDWTSIQGIQRRYEEWMTLLDGLGLGHKIFEKECSFKPLLNGSEIQARALPGLSGEAFKQVLMAQEEWQVRHCLCDDGSIPEDEKAAALIDYLVRRFPQYQ